MHRRACTGLLSLGTQAAVQVDSVPRVPKWMSYLSARVDRILHSVIVAWKSHLYVHDAARIERVFFDVYN